MFCRSLASQHRTAAIVIDEVLKYEITSFHAMERTDGTFTALAGDKHGWLSRFETDIPNLHVKELFLNNEVNETKFYCILDQYSQGYRPGVGRIPDGNASNSSALGPVV